MELKFEPKLVTGNEQAEIEILLRVYNFALEKYMDQGKNLHQAHTCAIVAVRDNPKRVRDVAEAIADTINMEINKENAQ